jgi:exonuclease SbcC
MEMEDEVISSLSLKNYQAHKDTTIEFDPHITAIVGSSDSGKTSLLRSLYWVLQNKPGGTQMVSFWNRKKDGSPKDETSASILIDDKTITRIRTPDLNGYLLDKKELSAIGREVPEQITQIFNLSDINIGRQFDRHFLLSESSGEVARRLNELVRLDIIDEVLSKAEQLKRANRKAIEANTTAQNEAQTKIEALSWVDKANRVLASAHELKEGLDTLLETQEQISSIISKVEKLQASILPSRTRARAKKKIEEIDKLLQDKEITQKLHDNIQNVIMRRDVYTKCLDQFKKIRKAKRYFEMLEELKVEKESISLQYNELQTIISNKEKLDKTTEKAYITMKKVKEDMPDSCPLCGKPLNEEDICVV